MRTPMLQNRYFTLSLQPALWLGLGLIFWAWRGNPPAWQDRRGEDAVPPSRLPVEAFKNLFASESWIFESAPEGALNPFATRHFIPVAAAAVAPTTQKIEFVYQGFSRTATQPERVFVQVDNKMVVHSIGSSIAPELFIANVSARECTLTNSATQVQHLKLGAKTVLEVPVK